MTSMNQAPMANRFTVGLFGKRNAGKSSLLNALTGQAIAVISPQPGTTTDPVTKAMELLPLGPIALIDTAGYDDTGELGSLRVEKTYEILRKCDLALVVGQTGQCPDQVELDFLDELKARGTPAIYLLNKADQQSAGEDVRSDQDCGKSKGYAETKGYTEVKDHIEPKALTGAEKIAEELDLPVMAVSALTGEGIDELKSLIVQQAPKEKAERRLMDGLIGQGDVAVLVVPLDKSAPKGRLILPQQQVIRDILEMGGISLVTGVEDLLRTLDRLREVPAIVITDAQAFGPVAKAVPVSIPLTSFSMIFARHKADLAEMVSGVKKLESLRAGDRVLIIEGCTHHRQEDDIGRVKIPQFIRSIAGDGLEFHWVSGVSFPKEVGEFALLVHCGGCMLNRPEMAYRVRKAKEAGTVITNYGVVMAYAQGILARATAPFHLSLD